MPTCGKRRLKFLFAKLTTFGMAAWTMTPQEFVALIGSDIATFAKVVKAANVKAE